MRNLSIFALAFALCHAVSATPAAAQNAGDADGALLDRNAALFGPQTIPAVPPAPPHGITPRPPAWDLTALPPAPAPAVPAPYGPARPLYWEPNERQGRHSFGEQVGAVKWEFAGAVAYLTAIHLPAFIKEHRSFRFEDEGFFGKSTANLGVDKMAHAWNGYLLADLLQLRIDEKLGGSRNSPLTAGLLSIALTTYSELYDAHETKGGFSPQDTVMNIAGAGLSMLRNSVPGLREKIDFRLLVIPNRDIISVEGKEHFRQQRFLLALQLAGFERLERSPLRFVELHAGYYAKGFTDRERARGERRERKPFFGVGLNLQELFFRNPRSNVSRLARNALDYIQVPYTAFHVD